MRDISSKEYGGERPLYMSARLHLTDVMFHEGESALKECRDIYAERCLFESKYALWECQDVTCDDCRFAPSSRSSIWYSRNINMNDCLIESAKPFREASALRLSDLQLPNAAEAFWYCSNVILNKSTISGSEYLFLHATDARIDRLQQSGDYSFQHAANIVITNSVINSKDAFWESDHCTIIDSEINAEYLGWYSRNLRLVRCHINGLQPLCYCTNLQLIDCTFGNDSGLAFEYSTLNATIKGSIPSVKNPASGSISADHIGHIILDEHQKSPADCIIQQTDRH